MIHLIVNVMKMDWIIAIYLPYVDNLVYTAESLEYHKAGVLHELFQASNEEEVCQ